MRFPSRRIASSLLIGWPVLTVLVHSARLGHWVERGASVGPLVGWLAAWAGIGALASGAVWWSWTHTGRPAEGAAGRLVRLGVLCLLGGLVFAALTDQLNGVLIPFGRRRGPFWSRAILPTLAMYAWAAVHYTLETHRHLAEQRQRTLEAEALAAEARLAILRYELNPHFLFNALNSIIGVIAESPPDAVRMVRQLAGLLRHTLDSPAVSTLGEEVKVASAYLAIEKVRFEERLEVEMDVPEALYGLAVPPMILQPLVENAVKHGDRREVLRIGVRADRDGDQLVVTVRNGGRLAEPREGAVGLRNLAARLESAGRGTATLVGEGDEVVATLRLDVEEAA
jgi:sensor histidine kinase YesM